MKKLINLTGRIDSSNANEIEMEITAELTGSISELTIDTEKLDYISSAGLRIILRLKKLVKNTKIVKCSPAVYDIFDMTGFTEMMDITRAYRKVSVEGCEVIGEGANGIVYRTDPDTIVKVYKNPDALEEIHNERELARKAFVMGVPTAIPYDVVQVGDLYGSVFELLNAESFAQLIRSGESVEELAKDSVEILKIIHSTMLKDGELPNKREEAIGWAEYVLDYLPDETGKKLLELFKGIPETNNMLHGDFHIKNIMRQGNENLLIDMDTLSMGHPIYEFAAIYAAYIGFSCVDKTNCSTFLGISSEQCEEFWNDTLKDYFEGESEEFLQGLVKKCEIICFTRVLRRTIKHYGENNAEYKELRDYCKNYLIDNVNSVDSLYY